MVNLSAGGCGIEGIKLVGGKYLTLLVVFPEEQSPIIIDLAAVRWAAKGQAGFEFLWMRPTQQARMQQVLPY